MALPTEHWRPTPRPAARQLNPAVAWRLNVVVWVLLLPALALLFVQGRLPLPPHADWSSIISRLVVGSFALYAAMALAGFGLLANLLLGLGCYYTGRHIQAAKYLAGFGLLVAGLPALWWLALALT